MNNRKKVIIISSLAVLTILGILTVICISNIKEMNNSDDDNDVMITDDNLIVKSVSSFHDGLAVIKVNNKYGYINKKGKIKIKPIYSYADDFNEGFALACKAKEEMHRCGYINTDNNPIIDFEYESGSIKQERIRNKTQVKDGLVLVKDTSKEAIFDTSGKQLSPFYYNKVVILGEDGIVAISNDDSEEKKYTIVNAKDDFKPITDEKFDVVLHCSNGMCAVGMQKSKNEVVYQYIDYEGKTVSNYKNNHYLYKFNSKGIVQAEQDGKLVFINKTGELVTDKFYDRNYGECEDEGCLVYNEDSMIVGIDEYGKEMFQLSEKYSIVRAFTDGYALIEKYNSETRENEYFYISKKGTIDLGPYMYASPFSDGYALVKAQKNSFYFINTKGEKVIEGKYVD